MSAENKKQLFKKRYFDVHVFHSRNNGYSIPIETVITDDYLGEEIISEAVNQDKLDPDDMNCVDYVKEINQKEYKDMLG